jgi:hypothetical protein
LNTILKVRRKQCRFCLLYDKYLLYDKICRVDMLAHAYALARANAGAPGVDGMTFAPV